MWLYLLEYIAGDDFNDSRPAESIRLDTCVNEECTSVLEMCLFPTYSTPGYRHKYKMLSYSRSFRLEFPDLIIVSPRRSTATQLTVDTAS